MVRGTGVTRARIRDIQGALFTGDVAQARRAVGHLVLMTALVMGGVYGSLFLALDVAPNDAWWYGDLFGHSIIGGLVVGAIAAGVLCSITGLPLPSSISVVVNRTPLNAVTAPRLGRGGVYPEDPSAAARVADTSTAGTR